MNLHDRPLIEQIAFSYAAEIERLNAEIARLQAENTAMNKELDAVSEMHDLAIKANARLQAALEEVKHSVQSLMPDAWSDAPYVMSVINKALANEHKS